MPTSRTFVTAPTAEFDTLMSALDAWIKSLTEDTDNPPTWEDTEHLLGSMLRAVRYGDSTCDCGSRGLNHPFSLTSDDGGQWWTATYRCGACGSTYTCGWADSMGV
jgi:hypothetical protein